MLFRSSFLNKDCKGSTSSAKKILKKFICPGPSGGGCGSCLPAFEPLPGKIYIISGWAKEDLLQFSDNYTQPGMKVNFYKTKVATGGSVTTELDESMFFLKPTGPVIEGWQRIEGEFTMPTDAFNVQMVLQQSSLVDIFYDDIRIHPKDGKVKTWVYDPISLRMLAEQDENNYSTFYEYSEEGKLIRVKKETEDGKSTLSESSSTIYKE